MPDHTRFGDILRAARDAQALSQDELSYRSGIGRSNISDIERGIINPTYRTMACLALGLGANLKINFAFEPKG